MTSIVDWFQAGGAPVFVILFMDLMGGLVIASALVLAFLTRYRKWGLAIYAILVLGTCIPTLTGAAGWMWGRARVQEALSWVNPEDRWQLLERGYAEALVPLWVGLGSTLILGLPAVAALAVAVRRRKR